MGAIVGTLAVRAREAGSNDQSFDVWKSTICIQLIQALGITTACVPYLKPFLESFESGLFSSDDLRRRGSKGLYGYGAARSKTNRKSSAATAQNSKPGAIVPTISLEPLNRNEYDARARKGEMPQADRESMSSQARFIRHTTSWTIDSEPYETGGHHA